MNSPGPIKEEIAEEIKNILETGYTDALIFVNTPDSYIETESFELAENIRHMFEDLGASFVFEQSVAEQEETNKVKPENNERFEVILLSPGLTKIETIKVMREISPIGLVDAMNIVDKPGSVFFETDSREDAERYQQMLENAGASAEIRPSNPIVSPDEQTLDNHFNPKSDGIIGIDNGHQASITNKHFHIMYFLEGELYSEISDIQIPSNSPERINEQIDLKKAELIKEHPNAEILACHLV
jgi:large subunit ribosomal protein L7/L12